MRNFILASASAAALAVTFPASAAIILDTGNMGGGLTTVHLDGNASADVVNGGVQGPGGSDVGVLITGSEAIQPSSVGNGQTWVTALDGGLSGLTFAVAPGYTFNSFVFNTNVPNGKPTPYTVTLTAGGLTQSFDLPGSNNFFSVYTTAGETLSNVIFSSSLPLDGVGQIRFGGVAAVAAVPEPAAWATMIVGFAVTGAAMRRRRRAAPMFRLA